MAISPSVVFVIALFFACEGRAQTTNATTDLYEARALNSIFQQWDISASSEWNISGEPCSGAAIDSKIVEDPSFNPAIKCDCSYNFASTCHIIALKVYALDITGVIPDELWNLTFLRNLNLAQNYLSGYLPPSVGNLARMQYLSLGINSLSGVLPKELGKLTDLRAISFGTNSFYGPLPSELGNLTKLEQLYFDSSGVSGDIPSTFANLQMLSILWASDTELTGKLPDFIGNWSMLTSLRFQGNSFTGPIPPSFSSLTSLTELRISDISDGNTSLGFLKDMKSLDVLVLRNNNMSGSIPANVGEYKSLSQLDLSFNSLTGQIPDSLFNLSSLVYLFLGNNKLTGSLPSQKAASLLNIDLSYNELSGGFPTWVNQQNLQLNLVANSFTSESPIGSVLPRGLNCLQRNFQCNQISPISTRLAIKCGGPQYTSPDQIVYERDNETLGVATYYVTPTNRWAVSNVGLPTGSNSLSFTNSWDSELFQTARLSAGSLRYYGLGLQNGEYTVRLQFAEIDIPKTTWKRSNCLFQGNLTLKDFDIQMEALVSYSSVVREFRVQVSKNYLEIHLFWAGKGTCCIPAQGTYGPSISAISVTPNFIPGIDSNGSSTSGNPTTKKKSRTSLIAGTVVAVAVVSCLSAFAVYFYVERRKTPRAYEEFLGLDARPYTFSYSELRDATDDFSSTNKLGEGGFGPVYKGTLDDGRAIAVKQLSVASNHGKSQFVTEIATISAVQHRNLVKLHGCCIEGDKRLLVYEYLENRSLDQALFGRRILHLDWPIRFDISLGVARGLAYLHEESRLRIVHRDVKASNILLDGDLTPKISDFGLAKLYDDKKTHISTRVAGTIGYLAPEYALRGHLTEKADVFGFGVVALEIVSGRANSDASLEEERVYLLEWAWHLHENNREVELVDAKLSDFDENAVKRVIGVALLCTQTSPTLRPSMSRVVAMLSGDVEVSAVTSRPGYLTDWTFNDASTCTSGDPSRSDYSYYSSSTGAGIVADPNSSPANAAKPMLGEIT